MADYTLSTGGENSAASEITGTVPVIHGGTGVTTSTGTTNVVLSNSPVLVTPNLGTPSTLVGTNISGTAANLTAGTVTTNANLTGDITSIGNATTIKTSLNLPGSPTTTTQASTDNSTAISTTNFVATAIANAIAAVNPAVAVQAATNAILPNSPTYNNGVAGIGAFITTLTLNTALVVDGYTPALLERILVKNESAGLGAAKNGVYYVSQLHGVGLAWILVRALDYDQSTDMNNTGAIPVTNGTANTTTSWVQSSQVTTVGTDAVTFAQFSYAPSTLVTTSTSAGGDLTGTYPNPTIGANKAILSKLDASNATANKVLMSGASASPTWSTPTFPNASATNGKIIISDGTNWTASSATYPTTVTNNNTPVSDGTNWVSTPILGAELSSTPVTDTSQTTSSAKFYEFITLPSTAPFYLITGIEWKNGLTVSGNCIAGVDIVDANPPVKVSVLNVALSEQIAQTGASSIQRTSFIKSQLIPGGTIVGFWVDIDNGTGTFRQLVGGSQNRYKAVTYTVNVPSCDITAWSATTSEIYLKLYYKAVY